MVSMDYSGKNYIVTGGAGGIGGAVVDGIVSGGRPRRHCGHQ